MSLQIGVVMDPIQSINYHKDSTLAMLWAAQGRGWSLHYMEMGDLYSRDGHPFARSRPLTVRRDPANWFTLGTPGEVRRGSLDIILMRKDPPFDMEYVYATYILEQAQRGGALVVNHPRSLRDANEKFFATTFPHCTPPTLVARDPPRLLEFIAEQQEVVLKPLGAMGGSSIFKVTAGEANTNVIIETLTAQGQRYCMAQRYIPEIRDGDKRILLIDGEPIPYALARKPAPGEFRGNLAAGGKGAGQPLSERDRWVCRQVGPTLREMGLYFVGIDVIGDYLTEVNVTSPTCIRELDEQFGLDIAGGLMDALERRLGTAHPA